MLKPVPRSFENAHFLNVIRNRKLSTVLGIETSCDDTGVAIVNSNRQILAESKYNQWSEHKRLGKAKLNNKNSWPGGVIPNLAMKLHRKNLMWAVSECIEQMPNGWKSIDSVALTVKPGIEPCLWEGIQFTKLLLQKYELSFIPIHHMEAHALIGRMFEKELKFPFLTLLISGGHCLLALVENVDDFSRLGNTNGISPGVLLDKVARHLGLLQLDEFKSTTSGGALVEKYGENGDINYLPKVLDSVKNFCFKNKNCDFSFTGFLASFIKSIDELIEIEENTTSIIVNDNEIKIEKKVLKRELISHVCATLQHIISYQLEDRLKRALRFLSLRNIQIGHVVVSGGVASNLYIRQKLETICETYNVKLMAPPVKYCTDNGVMIAWTGIERLNIKSKEIVKPSDQDENFFKSIIPTGRCDLGKSIDLELKNYKIKI